LPQDWYGPALKLIAALAWPGAIVILLLVYQKAVTRFIDDVSELSGFGALAKRQGNRLSRNLETDVREGSVEPIELEGGEASESSAALTVEASFTADAEVTKAGELLAAEANKSKRKYSNPTLSELLAFEKRVAISQLRSLRYGASTGSSRIAAEIVANAFSVLRGEIRRVGFLLEGVKASAVSPSSTANWAALETILHRVSAPESVIASVRSTRKFAGDVDDATVRVDGDGAVSFLATCEEILSELFAWAEELSVGIEPSDD